jgi:hypothetical protein
MFSALINFMSGTHAQAGTPSTQTITGRVVALAYYGQNKARRGGGLDQSRVDMRASVRWEGNPAGIVTPSGEAYQIIGGLTANSNAKIAEYLGQTVSITGEVSMKYGMQVISADNVTPSR